MDVAVIINPVAGGRRRGLTPDRRVRLATEALDRHGVTGRIELTTHAGHGRDLARQAVADGCRLVVAWGGDGTINEVASSLLCTGVALGVVRSGSGNGLAREIGIPRAAARALDIALSGRERVIDIGEAGGRAFVNLAGVGFDAAMAAEFNRLGTERRGPLRYIGTVLGAAFAFEPSPYALDVDGRRFDVNALLVVVANLPQYGANTTIAPSAKPDDGLLDVVVIEDRGALGRLGLAPRFFDRTIHKAPGVLTMQAREVEVRGRAPIAFHVDGEPQQGGEVLRARVRPGALRVRVG
jgi:diacylglycerol kinase (ATP)